jgi:hypothetical protein
VGRVIETLTFGSKLQVPAEQPCVALNMVGAITQSPAATT